MDLATQIATLGRLCGIAPEYWDNFGTRRRTSPATYQALLTAMGVPWEDPELLAFEIAQRRLRPWSALADSLFVLWGDAEPHHLILSPWTPTPERTRRRCCGTSSTACTSSPPAPLRATT